jgi:hypothetical protein
MKYLPIRVHTICSRRFYTYSNVAEAIADKYISEKLILQYYDPYSNHQQVAVAILQWFN